MAQLDTGGAQGGNGKKRAKKASTAIDMTPMVDLAFLLLTFFVLTSTFSKPKVLRMIFPEKIDKNDPAMKAPEVKNGLTILLTGDDKIYYYRGSLKPLPFGKSENCLLHQTVGFGFLRALRRSMSGRLALLVVGFLGPK